MQFDEPIIGLNFLVEEPSDDPQSGPKYTCRLCRLTACLSEMVCHVIGRKHRQKYLEVKRPDLVTWDKQNQNQSGKIIRARAVIVERQDGRGAPVPMEKKMPNKFKAPQRQQQNWGQNMSQNFTQPNFSQLPRLMDFRHPPGFSKADDPFRQGEQYNLGQDSNMYQQKDAFSRGSGKEMQRGYRKENDMSGGEYMGSDFQSEYDQQFHEYPQESNNAPKYDSRAEMPRGQAQQYYTEEAPSQRRPYQGHDPLKEFYDEEVRLGRVRSENLSSQQIYPEGHKQRWSQDKPSDRQLGLDGGDKRLSELEARRSHPATLLENRGPRDHLFNVITDYGHNMRDPHQGEEDANPGPSRAGAPNPHRQVEITRTLTNIPEPFRRFLKGPTPDMEQGKRKRKSRFSDATAEEVATTKRMLRDEYGPPNPKFGTRPRPVGAPLRPEILQAPPSHLDDLYAQSQGPHHDESYQREETQSEGVFDMLKNIEIDNAEEANFLKSKLCSLLKEFKAKKSDKSAQSNYRKSSEDYNDRVAMYETGYRDDSDLRQTEGPYFEEDHTENSWKQPERIPKERLQAYHHPVQNEARHPNLNQGAYEEPGTYPERFHQPMHGTHDYRPATQEFFNSRSSAPPLHTEQGARMDRSTRYSRNLDKITSTLLEFVARK
ncbi:uncharacterized protein V6R79_000282 [Siganus canaliculatus]